MLKLTRIAALALIALALVLALAAFGVARRASSAPIRSQSALPGIRPTAVGVVEAAADLHAGIPIAAQDLRIGEHAHAIAGSYGSIPAVAGSVPQRDIPAGTAITPDLLAQGLSIRLNPGERALAVPVDELVGAGNRIAPGDYVDVFLNLKNSGPNQGDGQTRLLLSRLRVLSYGGQDLGIPTPSVANASDAKPAAGSRADDIAPGSSGTRTAGSAGTVPVRSAVLAVPVAAASRLLLGAQSGKLFLALRHPGDPGQPDEALFPQPRGVLTPRAGLSPEQRLALAAPENDAFAGIDAAALAGQGGARATPTPRPASAVRVSSRADNGIEIIRGDAISSRSSRGSIQ